MAANKRSASSLALWFPLLFVAVGLCGNTPLYCHQQHHGLWLGFFFFERKKTQVFWNFSLKFQNSIFSPLYIIKGILVEGEYIGRGLWPRPIYSPKTLPAIRCTSGETTLYAPSPNSNASKCFCGGVGSK